MKAGPMSQAIGLSLRTNRLNAGASQRIVAEYMTRSIGYKWHCQTVGEVEAGRRSVSVDELVFLNNLIQQWQGEGASDMRTYPEDVYAEIALPATIPAGVTLWWSPGAQLDLPEGGTVVGGGKLYVNLSYVARLESAARQTHNPDQDADAR